MKPKIGFVHAKLKQILISIKLNRTETILYQKLNERIRKTNYNMNAGLIKYRNGECSKSTLV